jgi:hypothetical protein
LLTATEPLRSSNLTNFGWPMLLLPWTFVLHEGDPKSPPRLMPARGQPLWVRVDAPVGQDDPQVEPVPEHESDQCIARQRPQEGDPIGFVSDRLRQGSPRPRRPPWRSMAILALRFWRGFPAPSTRFPRIMTAVRVGRRLEHLQKCPWISYSLP